VAVLRINGHTVPVELGTLRVETVEVGATNKAYDGSTLNLRYGFKRRISFTTTPLSEMEAFALEGLVQGQGEYWSFDGNSTLEYLYSSRGVGPTTSTGNAQTSTNKFGGYSLDPGTVLIYPKSIVTGLKDFTVNAWISDALSNPGTEDRVLLATNNFSLTRSSGASDLKFETTNSGTHTLTKSSAWDGHSNFKMITAVIRSNPETGENAKELYYNGSSAASESSASTAKIPDLSGTTEFTIGNDGGSAQIWTGFIDELLIVPYAATSDIVSAWYAMGKAMSPLPKVYVDGDVIPDDALTSLFFGYVKDSTYLMYGRGASRTTVSSNNKRKLSITLEEA